MDTSRWNQHWQHQPLRFQEEDFLRQVGKTVNREPVPWSHIDCMVQTIADAIRLEPDDVVLDLCCGNGLLTHRLAPGCRQLLGVDFSAPLIKVAEKHHRRANVRYLCRPVEQLAEILADENDDFTKAYIYEAFQHFDHAAASQLLSHIGDVAGEGFRLFLGSIPDRDRIYAFYDSPERREEYERRRKAGSEAIGTWWSGEEIRQLAADAGFRCTLRAQAPLLYTAHYRFDALLEFNCSTKDAWKSTCSSG